MAQHPVEIILAQRLASHLAMPVFLVGAEGEMLYYNDAAEAVFGYRFDETGSLPIDVWPKLLVHTDEAGNRLAPEDQPLVRALRSGRPVHQTVQIQGMDGVERSITGTCLPLEGQGGRHVGALAVFWEDEA